jgi:hypothetical protein
LQSQTNTIDIGQALASGVYRPPVGIISSVAGPLPVAGNILRPNVDAVATAASSGMAPLAVTVTPDVPQLNKIRQSPEMASNLLSHPGTFTGLQLTRAFGNASVLCLRHWYKLSFMSV